MPVGKFYREAVGPEPTPQATKTTPPNKTTKPADEKRGSFRVNFPAEITELYPELRDAVYLVIWLLDKVTKEYWETFPQKPSTQRIGIVRSGKPVAYSEIAEHFQCDVKTVKNWREIARDLDLIRTKRAPRGYKYAVVDTRKWPSREPQPHLPKWAKWK